jgi:AcrR family transcriptional regulator
MPKIVDHAQYRQQLLINCFDLFADKGYSAITMRQIAQGLGVSTGTLYHYFPSKEVLFEQFVAAMSQRDFAQIAMVLNQAKTPAERLEIGYHYLAENRDYFFKQMLIFADFHQHQDSTWEKSVVMQQIDQQVEQIITDILEINDSSIARFVLAHIDGLIFGTLYGEDPNVIKQQAQVMIKLLSTYWQDHRLEEP